MADSLLEVKSFKNKKAPVEDAKNCFNPYKSFSLRRI